MEPNKPEVLEAPLTDQPELEPDRPADWLTPAEAADASDEPVPETEAPEGPDMEALPEAEDSAPTKRSKNSLLVYVTIMFAAAFLMVLLSFFVQQRSSSETISTLSQTSATAMGRAQELESNYTAQLEENNRLSTQLDSLTQQYDALQTAYDTLADQNSATAAELADRIAAYDALAAEQQAQAQASAETQAALEAELETRAAQTAADEETIESLTEQLEAQTARANALALLLTAAQAAMNVGEDGDLTALDQALKAVDVTLLDPAGYALYQQLQQRLAWASSEHAG